MGDFPIARAARTARPRFAAGALIGLALVAGCAVEPMQQASALGTPPAPAWAQGRPASMASSPLAPHAAKMTVTAPNEIPMNRIRVPAGFKVELWAHGLPGGRMMARGNDGTIYVGTRGIGRVYAVADRGGSREVKVLAQGLTQPNGVAYRNGTLYVAAINQVLRYDDIDATRDSNPKPVDMTGAFNLPPDQHHGWKFLAIGPDGKLYVPVGAPCNICEVDKDVHANIRRYNLDGSGMEIVARGVRNSVGFDFHPKTGELWFTDNGRDWAGEDGPQEELNRVSRVGANFGFPYCHADGIADPDLKKWNACWGVTRPVALLGPHAAALGMRFYTGSMFPAEYRDSVLVARRGSWNRTQKYGYDVVRVTVTADGRDAKVTPFVWGFLDQGSNSFWGRPVDVLQLPDGSVLVSDEQLGAIYRVSYGR